MKTVADRPRTGRHSLRPALAFLLLMVLLPLPCGAQGTTSGLAGRGYRELFREGMRHGDLGRWQEALILFDGALKRKATEGERVRFYGRKRFPTYVPRFYVGKALFLLGDYAKALDTWRFYDDPRNAHVLPPEERAEIARYRLVYDQSVYPALFYSIARQMVAARASLASLQAAGGAAGREVEIDVDALLRSVEPHCRAPVRGGADRLQALRACLDATEARLDAAARLRDHKGTLEAGRIVKALAPLTFELHPQNQAPLAVTPPTAPGLTRSAPTPEFSATSRAPSYRPTTDTCPGNAPYVPPGVSRLYAGQYALIIGIWDYGNAKASASKDGTRWKDLPGVKEDVEKVSAALRGVGYQVECSINPTKKVLEETLRSFLQDRGSDPNNQVLVYYAGHGGKVEVQDNELGFFVPSDATLTSKDKPWWFSAIPLYSLVVEIQTLPARHVLAVLDSCFSGQIFNVSFEHQARRGGRTGPEARGQEPLSSATQGLPGKTGGPLERYLRRSARFYLTAGRANDEVPDRSLFRRAFVEALSGPPATLEQSTCWRTANQVLTFRDLHEFIDCELDDCEPPHRPVGDRIGIGVEEQGQILFQLPSAAGRDPAGLRPQVARDPAGSPGR